MFIFTGKKKFPVESIERQKLSKRNGLSRNSGDRTIYIRQKTGKEQVKGVGLKGMKGNRIGERKRKSRKIVRCPRTPRSSSIVLIFEEAFLVLTIS